jgi:cobalt-zinc-cadmium efflux system protein
MGHGHHHHHNHHHSSEKMEGHLKLAVGANILLTLAQIIGGIISGSLSLIADALHNFSDAASLVIALIAIRIGKKSADEQKTFGYRRAETVSALINLTSLIIIGLYLCYEAIHRFINPEPITGWMIILVAGIALIVDIFTAILTYSQSKHSLNIRAAFLHNLIDGLASVGVIIAGVLIMLFGWVWTDAAITLIIAGYVLYQGFTEFPKVVHILLDGTPEGVEIPKVIQKMIEIEGVSDVHHIHIWQLDEQRNALEAHVVLQDWEQMEGIKFELKKLLKKQFSIEHSTLEFEQHECPDSENNACYET